MKKFKTANGSTCRIPLTSGHVFNVTSEWKELPEIAHSMAYSKGCISEDMITGDSKVGLTTEVMANINDMELEKNDIKLCIQKAIDQNDMTFFKKDGSPNMVMLSKSMGRSIDRALVQDVWGMMCADREIEIELD